MREQPLPQLPPVGFVAGCQLQSVMRRIML